MYLLTHAVNVWIYDWHCECGTYNEYNGVEDHLYRPHKSKPARLIHHSLFDQYRSLSYTSCVPLFAWHKSIKGIYHNHNSKVDFVSRPSFMKYFGAYLNDCGTDKDIKCNECYKQNKLPSIITSDGTDLLQTYANVQNCISPAETVYCHEEEMITMKKAWQKTRKVYIKQKELREKVVYHFKTSRMATQPTDTIRDQDKPFSGPDLDQLYEELNEHLGNDNYSNCLKWCAQQHNTTVMRKSKYISGMWGAISHWVRSISNPNIPLFTLVKNEVIDAIAKWEWNENEQQPNMQQFRSFQSTLNNTSPLLSKVIHLISTTPTIQFPKCLYLLIQELAQLSKTCLSSLEKPRLEQPPPPQSDKIRDIYIKSHISGTCYGAYKNKPITTMRPKYDYDSEKKQREKWYQVKEDTLKILSTISEEEEEQEEIVNDEIMESDHDSDNDDLKEAEIPIERGDDVDEETMTTTCNKEFNNYDKMSGGLIVASCVEHSQAMGYNIIKGGESVNDHFSLVMAIYPGFESPEHHIMDNACNYYPYCMAREPTKFKNMNAWTDEFHGIAGHKCGILQSVKTSKQMSERLIGVNDSIIEQMNRILQRLHICAMWMSLETFDAHVKMILDMFNRRSMRKAEEKKLFY